MRLHHTGDRARLGLATILALVVGLVGATSASAAPGDNLRNAAKCLRGWHTLRPTSQQPFAGPLSCIVYALRGGAFVVTTPQTPDPGSGGQ